MALFGHSARHNLPDREQTLPGRAEPLPGIPDINLALGTSMHGPWPDGTQVLYLAMGCFWGSERIYWRLPGVVTTAAGYQGGYTPNPTYDEVCSGRTGHAEAVLVAYDPAVTSIDLLLKAFWENHDPTQGFRQGNDHGTQYRSALWWTTPEQEQAVLATRDAFQDVLRANSFGDITTELRPAEEAGEFYYAEAVHQQYLHKNPGGYCNHGPNGMTCPVGIVRQDQLPSQESVLGRTD